MSCTVRVQSLNPTHSIAPTQHTCSQSLYYLIVVQRDNESSGYDVAMNQGGIFWGFPQYISRSIKVYDCANVISAVIETGRTLHYILVIMEHTDNLGFVDIPHPSQAEQDEQLEMAANMADAMDDQHYCDNDMQSIEIIDPRNESCDGGEMNAGDGSGVPLPVGDMVDSQTELHEEEQEENEEGDEDDEQDLEILEDKLDAVANGVVDDDGAAAAAADDDDDNKEKPAAADDVDDAKKDGDEEETEMHVEDIGPKNDDIKDANDKEEAGAVDIADDDDDNDADKEDDDDDDEKPKPKPGNKKWVFFILIAVCVAGVGISIATGKIDVAKHSVVLRQKINSLMPSVEKVTSTIKPDSKAKPVQSKQAEEEARARQAAQEAEEAAKRKAEKEAEDEKNRKFWMYVGGGVTVVAVVAMAGGVCLCCAQGGNGQPQRLRDRGQVKGQVKAGSPGAHAGRIRQRRDIFKK